MRSSITRLGSLLVAITSALLIGLVPAVAAPVLPPQASPVAGTAVPVCPGPTAPGDARCHALRRTDLAPSIAPSGYGPADLQSAYKLTPTAGSGQTVAIVDAFDDPNAETDLGVYRAQFGLAACTTANGCFRKVDQNGGTKYPRGSSGWAQEISLDLDMASAICPSCH